MKHLLIILFALLLPITLLAELSGDEIVRRVDDKMDRTGALIKTEMKVFRKNKLRKTYRMMMKSIGTERVLVEFFHPPRNKGEKFLKVEKSMWIYRPKINKVIRLSGRSTFSGSDFSNTDVLSVRLDLDYNARILGIEHYGGEEAYKLELLAKSEEVTYAKIIYWVRKKDLVPLKREFYTISGHLLKTLHLKTRTGIFDTMPDTFVMTNILEKNKKSVMQFLTYKDNQNFPASIFRKNALKKKR
ncbi:MAG: outer membrane lipoprotein-sorting protein [bacterium]|nr:outer membrane lipoprotein-sorting protein [bacterium]